MLIRRAKLLYIAWALIATILRQRSSNLFICKVDCVIDICSDVMNLRTVSYECKNKLEEIKDDYKIEVSMVMAT